MKLTVVIGRVCVNGTHRQEVANWLVEITQVANTELRHKIDDVIHIPIAQTPTPVARNRLVQEARKQQADYLFMVDDDSAPAPGFFLTAFNHLTDNPPCVIGSPYCCGGEMEQVQVFHWASPNNDAQQSFSLKHIPREEAARRTGIEQVPNVGTHCIAYHMKAFEAFEKAYKSKVYYDYTYNEEHTKVTETEDCYFHRQLYFASVPLYVSWEHWADHYKTRPVTKPYVVERKDIETVYLNQARAEVKAEDKG